MFESKTSTTNFEPNWKQALVNIGQNDGHGPSPHPGFPENGAALITLVGAFKGKARKALSFIPSSSQGQACFLVLTSHLLVVRHTLCSWATKPIYRIQNMRLVIVHEQQSQHSRKLSVLCQCCFQVRGISYRSLKHSSLNLTHDISPQSKVGLPGPRLTIQCAMVPGLQNSEYGNTSDN